MNNICKIISWSDLHNDLVVVGFPVVPEGIITILNSSLNYFGKNIYRKYIKRKNLY